MIFGVHMSYFIVYLVKIVRTLCVVLQVDDT